MYAVTKKGRRSSAFEAKDPQAGAWCSQAVLRRLLEAFEVVSSGKVGEVTEKDAQTVRALFERTLGDMPALQARVRKEPTPISALFERYLAARCTRNGEDVLERKRAIFADSVADTGDLAAHDVSEKHAAAFLKKLMEQGTAKGKTPLAATTARDDFSYVKAAFEFGLLAAVRT